MEQKKKKWKEGFLTVLDMAIKKDSITSIRKQANELKVHEKTVMTAVKQDLRPDLDPLDYVIWEVLENKTKQMQLPIQILVHLRLILRKNGIKYLKTVETQVTSASLHA